MNTATATQRFQTTWVLSLALLICGTTDAAHISEHVDGELYRHGQERFARDTTPHCVNSLGSRTIIVEHDARLAAPSCSTAAGSVTTTPPPVRLARPLTDSQYIRFNDSIRYSF